MRHSTDPVKVRRLNGHPVVVPERHATRPSPMWPGPSPLFPDWFSSNEISSCFEFVDTGPEITILTLSYHTTLDDLDRLRSLREPRVPMAVIYTLDDLNEPARGGWDRTAEWCAAIREFALGADLLVGPQLPADLPHDRFLPLPHAPVVPFCPPPRPTAIAEATTDLYFAGAWYPVNGTDVPLDSRDRTYRAYLVDRLRAGLPSRVLELRRVHYWRTNPLNPGGPAPPATVKADLLDQHIEALDRTRISLAPVGYGYYTTRHSDTLARGRALLTEPIHRHIHLPEPERWEGGELAVFYESRAVSYESPADDIVEIVAKVVGDHRKLQSVAETGWHYAQRHLRPDRQVHTLAAAVRALVAE